MKSTSNHTHTHTQLLKLPVRITNILNIFTKKLNEKIKNIRSANIYLFSNQQIIFLCIAFLNKFTSTIILLFYLKKLKYNLVWSFY